jgi:hypothetical protein
MARKRSPIIAYLSHTIALFEGWDMLLFTKIWIAALIAMLVSGAALAEPMIIVIISGHNLRYAENICSYTHDAEGIAECKFFGGPNLGRRLENDVRSRMATSPRCQGVDVFRLNDLEYDGKNNIAELADQTNQFHWDLFLEYNPGQTKHNWDLFPLTGGDDFGGKLVSSGIVSGEGNASQIADQICIVVTKRGANLR